MYKNGNLNAKKISNIKSIVIEKAINLEEISSKQISKYNNEIKEKQNLASPIYIKHLLKTENKENNSSRKETLQFPLNHLQTISNIEDKINSNVDIKNNTFSTTNYQKAQIKVNFLFNTENNKWFVF